MTIKTKQSKHEKKFEKMAEEATLDCYGEYEQFSGWSCTLEEKLPLPLKCLILGEEAILTGIETDNNGTSVLGIVKREKWKIRVPIQDIELKDTKAKHAEWIEAYRHWLG